MDPAGQSCASCSTLFPSGVLSCPSCYALVHAGALKQLGEQARAAAERADVSAELAAWRTALSLLPHASRQHGQVRDKIDALSRALEAGGQALPPQAPQGTQRKQGVAAALAATALLLWKFKAVVVFLATKAKFLLLGLTKAKTLFSMLLSMGLYFTLFGWKFAVGLVLGIYVHEMGHVAALRKLGIAASAPMFVPGLGAYVRMHQYPSTPSEDARVGLAGPVWGFCAALACALVYYQTSSPIWGALAKSCAFLNLFNLIPVWQLDGARGFHALTKRQRFLACGTIAAAWVLTEESLLLILLLVGLFRAFGKDGAAQPDQRAFFEYSFLVGALAALTKLHVDLGQ